MSWVPPNLAEACQVHTTITSCQPQTFLFLQLVANLFGRSRDAPKSDFGHHGYDFSYSADFFDFFDTPHAFGGGRRQKEAKVPEYDFIVVGAGSAGCVVANRLTEVPHWNVLLLEAGDEEPEVADVPAFAPMLQRSSIDWGFMTQPSHHSCLARPNGQCAWARGKVMGGSSTINYMIYIRGHPRDYDEWAEKGNKGWSYYEVLPYFIKSEHNMDVKDGDAHYHSQEGHRDYYKIIEPHYHGVHGPLSVEQFPYQDKNVFAVLQAYEELGLKIFDQNTEHQIGASLLQHTTKHGERHSTNRAFISPIRKKRTNLVVETRAHALRILIDPHTKSAYGVEYLKDGKLVQAVAKKEVIVSCGTIMSPKILMLSGVGPAHHLKDHGIEVLKDLPVGYNLHDHTTIDGVVFALTNKTATTADDEQMRHDVYKYKSHRKGPLTSTGPLQTNAFVQTKYEYEHDRADIQYSMDSVNVKDVITDPILAAATKVQPLAYYDGLMVRPILLNPKSRGYIKLNDSDPVHGHPLIHANTFYEEIDLLRMVEGVKQSLNLLKTHAMRKIGARLVATPLPHCKGYKFGSDEYIACVAVSYTTTIFHFVGTCKMGPHDDPEAVVDPELRVYGVKALRVIDASIMPKIVRGNTNAPTIMIAEKGSDYIKKDWLKDFEPVHGHTSINEDLFDKDF